MCSRCGNKKWTGQYPICDQCETCSVCSGNKFVFEGPDAKKCTGCNGKGWKLKEPLKT